MSKSIFPTTPATRYLQSKKISYIPHQFEYQEKGGTRQTASELKVDEHLVVKTLFFVSDNKKEMLVLMHGDLEVSTKELARIVLSKTVVPASPELALKSIGYQFGGMSPFGARKKITIYIEKSILELDKIYINGGKRGFILEMTIESLYKSLPELIPVKVGIHK